MGTCSEVRSAFEHRTPVRERSLNAKSNLIDYILYRLIYLTVIAADGRNYVASLVPGTRGVASSLKSVEE